MVAKLNMTRDVNGYPVYGLAINNISSAGGVISYSTTLAANAAQTITLPNADTDPNTWAIVFSFAPGNTIWVANNDTAAVPSSSFAQTSSQCNPSIRTANGGDTLSFITSDSSAQIGFSLYQIGPIS